MIEKLIKDTFKNLEKSSNLFLDKSQKKDFLNYLNSGDFEKFAVLFGGPQISHSLSPFIHTYSGFLSNSKLLYLLFDLEKYGFTQEQAYKFILENKNLVGGNITMPYKIGLKKIFEEKEFLDESVSLVGAVNTFYKNKEKIIAYNTDIDGIYIPLKQKLKNFGQKAYIFGAGGASMAIIGALLKLEIKNFVVFNRTAGRLKEIEKHFLKIDKNINFELVEYNFGDDVRKYFDKTGILFNSLPFGFKKNLPKTIIKEEFLEDISKNLLAYFDIVYELGKPKTKTSLILERFGITTFDGIDMLLYQAKKGFYLFSGGGNLDVDFFLKKFKT